MKHWMFFSVVVTAAALGGCAARTAQFAPRNGAPDTGIVVSGEGRASAPPDVAIVRVGVEAHRPTMAEARAASASAENRIAAAVRALGVAESDIQTDQLSLSADYEYGEGGRRLRGYVATHMIRIRLRDVTRAGEVVDATVTAGGDDARVDGVAFELADPSTTRTEARRRAIADARAKAEQLAAELGASIGDPIFVEEVAANMPGPVMMRMAESDASTHVEPGSLEVLVSVRVRWALER